MTEWIPAGVCGVLFLGSQLWWRAAGKRDDAALAKLRSATDAYRDAKREREEAHRVLRVACELHGIDPDAPEAEPEGVAK